MDLELLRTFIEVSHTKHFGHAAEKLFLTQSAVSARIRLLENQIGCSLFLRNSREVQLSPQGEKFIQHAKVMLDTWSRAQAELSKHPIEENKLAISSHAYLWHWPFADRLAAINAHWHTKTLSISQGLRELDDKQTDVLLTFKCSPINGFSQLTLGTLRLVLCADKQQLQQHALADFSYLAQNYGAAFEQVSLRHLRQKPPLYGLCDNPMLALATLRAQPVFTYLPEKMLSTHTQLQILEQNKAPIIKQPLVAIYASNSPHKLRLQALLSALKF